MPVEFALLVSEAVAVAARASAAAVGEEVLLEDALGRLLPAAATVVGGEPATV